MLTNTSTTSNHVISLREAIDLTRRFRKNRRVITKDEFADKDILPLAETFDKEAFRRFMDNENCKGIRIYLGMKEDYTIHSVIVGVDADNRDMLPKESTLQTFFLSDVTDADLTDPNEILENGQRCPPDCAPPSDLNTDPLQP
jgi:hypothetical protein